MTPDPIDRARAFFAEDERPERPRHGKYELVREAGRGGMAVVWEAWDPELKRRVALKIMQGGSLERLRREAEAAARLRHPGVVAVHDVGADFIAMDFVEGKTFDLADPRRLELLEQAAEAVAHAHAEGVVHRDLKPQNLLVTPDGRVVLTDFGLARIEGGEALTRTGAVVGTPHYMAPEQVRGEVGRIGPATDVWALGVLLYEAVSGRKPFDGPTPLAIHDAIVRSQPVGLGGDAGSVAAKALEKDPARRYSDAGAFLADLRNVKGGTRAEARRSDAGRWLRRNALPIALFAASALILAGGVVLGRWVTDERGLAVQALREQVRVSFSAALELRRAGANDRMNQFLPQMEAAYREAVSRAPNEAEVHWLMGRMYRALMENEKAVACQRRALQSGKSYPPAAYELALALATGEAGRLKLALDSEHGARPVGPKALLNSELAVVEAAATFMASNPSGAERVIAQALLDFRSTRDSKTAREALEALLKSDPMNEDARLILGWIIQAEMLPGVEERERRWAEEEKLYGESLDRDLGFVPHWLARGRLRWTRGSARRHRGLEPSEDYYAAELDFGKAAKLAPLDPEPMTWLGQVRTYRGIWELEQGRDPKVMLGKADGDLAKALELGPTSSRAAMWRGNAAFYRGVWLASQGLDPLPVFADSERWLDLAAKFGSADRIELRWRGRMLVQKGAALARKGEDPEPAFRQATLDFDACRSVDPWYLMWNSTLYSEQGRWESARGGDPTPHFVQARHLLRVALEDSPNFGEALRHRAMHRLLEGEIFEKQGKKAEARQAYGGAAADFQAALSVNPNFRYQIGERDALARKKADELK